MNSCSTLRLNTENEKRPFGIKIGLIYGFVNVTITSIVKWWLNASFPNELKMGW